MQNSKNGAVESVLSCDPLLQQLISAYSERNATAIESALGRVHEDVCSGSIRQGELGTADCVHVIFSILNELLGKPYALTRVESKRKVLDYTSLTAIHFDPGNTENQHESLIERCLWVLVRICRREMSKMSANDTNMELLESHQKSFEIITDICAQYVRSSRVVLPVCWLIMVLASDSSERQFRLASANATSLVVKIMAEHRSDVNIAEMACRAARNLAAGDSDVVAKFVEDRICEGLVCIIRAQIRHPKAAVKNDGNNHEAIISRKKVSNSESCPVTPVGTGISDSSMQPIIERPVNETVCEAALWAIVNLSCEENVSTILGSVGCIDAIVDVAITCRSAEVAMAAVSAIRNVSSVGTLNFSLLARTKVCEILLSNLKTYSSSIELVEVGLWALTNLACDCVLADRLGSLGAAKVVADLYYSIVPMHPQEGKPAGPISEVCLWVILNLAASSAENEDRLGEAGCCELVGLVLGAYKLREGMVDLAFNALIHLCYHSEANKSIIGRQEDLMNMSDKAVSTYQGLFQCILDASEGYKDNECIAENVLKLFLLSLNGTDVDRIAHNKQQLLRLNVPSFASEVMSSSSGHPEVVRLGCGLLLVLRFDDKLYKESLEKAGQLDGAGKANPRGTFSDISAAWEFKDSRTEKQKKSPALSPSVAEMPYSFKQP